MLLRSASDAVPSSSALCGRASETKLTQMTIAYLNSEVFANAGISCGKLIFCPSMKHAAMIHL